jgi:hypothetical protein
LRARPVQIEPRALLFDQQCTRPEQIHEAGLVVEQLHTLLIGRDTAALDAEDAEEFFVEWLRLSLFVMRVAPFLAEGAGAPFDLVPAKSHRRQPKVRVKTAQAPRFRCPTSPDSATPPVALFTVGSRASFASPLGPRQCIALV